MHHPLLGWLSWVAVAQLQLAFAPCDIPRISALAKPRSVDCLWGRDPKHDKGIKFRVKWTLTGKHCSTGNAGCGGGHLAWGISTDLWFCINPVTATLQDDPVSHGKNDDHGKRWSVRSRCGWTVWKGCERLGASCALGSIFDSECTNESLIKSLLRG